MLVYPYRCFSAFIYLISYGAKSMIVFMKIKIENLIFTYIKRPLKEIAEGI